LPDDLLADLDAAAAADNRTRNNLLTYMIRRIISNAPASQGLILNCAKCGGCMGPDEAC